MEKEFKAGDVVMLNSGSPLMTIEVISPSGENVRCRWFYDGYLAEPHWFKAATLMHARLEAVDIYHLKMRAT